MFLQANRVLEIDNQLIQSTSNFTINPTATYKIHISYHPAQKTSLHSSRFLVLLCCDWMIGWRRKNEVPPSGRNDSLVKKDMAAIIGGAAANYCCLSTLKIVISSEARNLSTHTSARHFERSEKPPPFKRKSKCYKFIFYICK
jgi:hypothetical protein